jgi:hypothetical protein
MPIDEELLKPSREHLALLRADIERQRELAASDIERYGYGSREYARQRWDEFHMATGPMYREIEAVVKLMADYYALQSDPPPMVFPAGVSRIP